MANEELTTAPQTPAEHAAYAGRLLAMVHERASSLVLMDEMEHLEYVASGKGKSERAVMEARVQLALAHAQTAQALALVPGVGSHAMNGPAGALVPTLADTVQQLSAHDVATAIQGMDDEALERLADAMEVARRRAV